MARTAKLKRQMALERQRTISYLIEEMTELRLPLGWWTQQQTFGGIILLAEMETYPLQTAQ
jgi:hypothetical protein